MNAAGAEASSAVEPACYALYGIRLTSTFPFTWPLRTVGGTGDVHFECVERAPVDIDLAHVPSVLDIPLVAGEPRVGISYHRLGDLDVVRFADHSDYYVWPDRILCHLHLPAQAWLIDIQLLGMVLALWLELRGTPTLHASTVVVDGRAVAFLGWKGSGKTTVATSLVAAGHPLLVDDLLALTLGDHAVLGQPGYPMLRLWPDQVEHFVGDHRALPLVHTDFTKRRVRIGTEFGSFHADPAPLGRVYLPERVDHGEVRITPIASRDALIELVVNSFLHDAVHPFGLAARRLERLVRVLEVAPVRRLVYPAGFERLPEVVAAVEDDLRTG